MFARIFEKERETLIVFECYFEYVVEGITRGTGMIDIHTHDEMIKTLLNDGWEEVKVN